jgi:hypothetical protein
LRRWYDFLASDDRLAGYQLRLNQKYQAALAAAFSEEHGTDPDTDLFANALSALLVSGTADVARMTVKLGHEEIVAQNSNKVIDLAETLRRETFAPERTTPATRAKPPARKPRTPRRAGTDPI